MKAAKTLVVAMLVCIGFIVTSCQKEDSDKIPPQNPQQEDVTIVKVNLDVSNIVNQTRSSSIANATKDLFNIYAFRQDENGNFIYEKTINLENLSYSVASSSLTGTDNIPTGTYKFLATYGLQQNSISIPSWSNEVLSDNLKIDYDASSPLSEIFLENSSVDELQTYNLLNDESIVEATLTRAVSRVDVLFVKAKRNNDNTYSEIAYTDGSDVFGGSDVNVFQMNFTDVNTSMNFSGKNLTSARVPLSVNIEDIDNNIIIGDGTQTTVGTQGYSKYDGVEQQDIIRGSAYAYGTFLFPNDNSDPSVGLSIYVEAESGDKRLINILNGVNNQLPVERNKITLVKVYVLGDNIFSTTADIAVSVDLEDITNEDEGDTGLWN